MAIVSRGISRSDVARDPRGLLRNLEVDADDVRRIIGLTREGKLGWVLDLTDSSASAYLAVRAGANGTGAVARRGDNSPLSLEFEYYPSEGTRWRSLAIRIRGGGRFRVDERTAPEELKTAVGELYRLIYLNGV